jgi:serine/threonine-protein kinase
VIFATTAPDTGLLEVSAAGGEPHVLTTPDPAKGEVDHLFPEILPGGQAVLFTIVKGGPIENSQIAVFDLRTRQSRVLVAGGSNPHYAASGHLVYGVGGTLRAIAFDVDRLQVRGDPVPVVEGVAMKFTGAASFSLARDGSLVYVAGGAQAVARTLLWVDRQGREDPIPAPPRGCARAPLTRRPARGCGCPRSGERHLDLGVRRTDVDAADF